MIWAQSTAGVIGHHGALPWRLPEDVAHFREATVGHPVIMGRRTWESLPDRFRPLPDRRNLVLSRSPRFDAPGAEVVGSLHEAIRLASPVPHTSTQDTEYDVVWLIGGAEILAAGAAGLASVAEVTEVDVDVPGDTFAPRLDGWRLEIAGDWLVSTTGLRYRFTRYLR